MQIFCKKRVGTVGRRVHIYFCGIKIASFKSNKLVEPAFKTITINTTELFFHQNKNIHNKTCTFNRLDTIVRYLAIENYYGKNDFGFALYEKMQNKRIGNGYADKAIPKFKELLQSWANNGYDTKSAIALNSDLSLQDGSHRLALAIFHDQQTLTCNVSDNTEDIEYGIDWFIENDFTPDEIKAIVNKYNDIVMKLAPQNLSAQ